MKTYPSFGEELKIIDKQNIQLVAGIDEVGRGSLAGPIVAGAVIFKDYKKIQEKLKGITDSKLISEEKRKKYDKLIRKHAYDYAIGFVDVEEIDFYGIGASNVLAFQKAILQLKKCDFALIDGRNFRGFNYPFKCIEKGELKSISIAAASIIAKVFRDNLMKKIHKKAPEYNFLRNKGYGGKKHFLALREFGPSQYHRKTFLLKFNTISDQASLF